MAIIAKYGTEMIGDPNNIDNYVDKISHSEDFYQCDENKCRLWVKNGSYSGCALGQSK